MFCTTECWLCEDKNCKHYISKQELYFDNQLLKSVLDEIREYIKEQIDYLTKIDGQNIPLNDKFQFCSMNELYQTGKYSGFKETLEKIEQILDKEEDL